MVTDPSALPFTSVSSSVLVTLSGDGTLREVNGGFSQLVRGTSLAVGKPFEAFLHETDRDAVASLIRPLRNGESVVFRARLCAELETGNLPRTMQFEVTRAGDDAFVVVGILGDDVRNTTSSEPSAELQTAEARIAALEKQLSTTRLLSQALKLAPMILWANDANGYGTHLEGGGLKMIGLDKVADPSKINIFESFKDRPEFLDALRRTLAGETTRRVANYGPATFETWYVPSRDEHGEVDGFIGLSVDVTARFKSEAELREKLEFIERQSATIRSLATPIIQVWDRVLCLPVIGTVDSERAGEMMQTLLDAIVRDEPKFAILDLTGVEVVDTSTADLILRLFRAAKLVGTEGVLCGIRPQVAQAITGLGLDLAQVRTVRSLRHALEWCVGHIETQ